MNIVVRTADGQIFVRPDVTLERNSEDLYPPEFVQQLSYTPTLYARICKPGKSIAAKFADRYYDGFNIGIMLYADDLIGASPEGFACASCLDHTTFLPLMTYSKEVLGHSGNIFCLKKGGEILFECSAPSRSEVEVALEDASRYVPVRSGDFLAIELAPRKPLCTRADGEVEIDAEFCENKLLNFKIKL